MLNVLERQMAAAEANGEARLSSIISNAAMQLLDHNNPQYFNVLSRLKQVPVTIEEFIDSPEFLGHQVECWPTLRSDLIETNPDILAGHQRVNECLDGGGTGTGKSFKATVTQAYQLYWLTCVDQPQTLFKLTTATPLVFMFQSVSEAVTRRVLYEPFRAMFTAMPYTSKWVQYDRYKEQELILRDNLRVIPALALVQAMVGQAIISGILDEVNFMNVVEHSQVVAGGRGLGGRFDQAEIAHKTISRRRKSRFTSTGPVPGCISVSSSIRYKGDFLDRRMQQAEENGEVGNGVKVYRRKQYEVQPPDRYSGERFSVLVGTDHWPTRILEDGAQEGEDYPRGAQVERVPVEYFYEFKNDPEGALRDVIGVSTDVIAPFITQRHKIVDAITRGRDDYELKPWVNHQVIELAEHGMPQFIEENLPQDRSEPRFIHVDLSVSNDRCGIAVVRLDGFKETETSSGIVEKLPKIVVEMAVGLTPSKQEHVDIAGVRTWLSQLVGFYGFNVYMVTYDGFQSTESMQMWRKQGVRSERVSTETTLEPYRHLRDCLYQDRIAFVDNEVLRLELVNLEYDERKKKVDHAPRFTNDIADAVCGAAYSAATSRGVRGKVAVTTKDGQTVRTNTGARRRAGSRAIGKRK